MFSQFGMVGIDCADDLQGFLGSDGSAEARTSR
jgi:hypothetical protein